jgi:hypothetical protein
MSDAEIELEIELSAERCANEITIAASKAGMSVRELWESTARTCKMLNEERRAREAKKMEVESPT